jgi:hypothetical protein
MNLNYDIKLRSWPRHYDYRNVVASQTDVDHQIQEWQKVVDMTDGPSRARSLCQVAYWKSIRDAQERRVRKHK